MGRHFKFGHSTVFAFFAYLRHFGTTILRLSSLLRSFEGPLSIPLSGALSAVAAGIGALGLLSWRRKRRKMIREKIQSVYRRLIAEIEHELILAKKQRSRI
jgi:hypothetical protein